MLTISEIVQVTKGLLLQGSSQKIIKGVHFDSRLLEENALFIALTGGARDGHQFVPLAKEKGAAAALISDKDIERENLDGITLILVPDTAKAFQQIATYYREKINIPIIAITGSNGKTTTKDMVAHTLTANYKVYKTYKNYNNDLGVPLSLLHIKEETDIAVLEMGMNHAGEIDLLGKIAKPSITVITNVGDSHIENLGSREGIAAAKGELLPHTDPNYYSIINGDDALVVSQADRSPASVYYYSIKKEADVFASNIHINDQGTSFTLHIKKIDNHVPTDNDSNNKPFEESCMIEQASCFLPLYGVHNVANFLPGAFIAYNMGISIQKIADMALSLAISEMRFQTIYGPNDSIIINDAYNASPTSMKAAIDTFLHIHPKRKKLIVLGDMYELGDEAQALHEDVGSFLKGKDCQVITVGEDAEWIANRAGGQHFATKEEVVEALQAYLNEQYSILFKASRGMKLEEVIEQLLA